MLEPDEELLQPSAPRGTETVLVVEDSVAVCAVVRRTLQQQGYKVIVASSAGSALRLAATLDPPVNLLLTDVVMPTMSGRVLAEKFVAFQPNARILYMSGFTDDTVHTHGIVPATSLFLQKPFSLLELATRVREALDG